MELGNKTGYNILQQHGQRIYGGPPPDWSGTSTISFKKFPNKLKIVYEQSPLDGHPTSGKFYLIFEHYSLIICSIAIFSDSFNLSMMLGPAPDRGTEVYCYRIPRDCFEDELVPVFQSVGKLYELRLMIEFSGANRSYCYVRYCNSDDAKKAILMLNNYPIRQGYPLAVTRSVDNRKLCIKTVPPLGSNVSEKNVVEVNIIILFNPA